MRILIDCDGVLADFVGGVLAGLHEILGREFHREDITTWSIEESLSVSRETIQDIVCQVGFCYSLRPLPGAFELVTHLRQLGEVYCVTSPFENSNFWYNERSAWLRNTLAFDSDHIIFASHKHLIQGNVLIDDNLDTCLAWAKAWPNSTAIVRDAPYNQSLIALPNNVYRVRQLQNVTFIIDLQQFFAG